LDCPSSHAERRVPVHVDPTAETFEPNGIGGHNAVIHT